MKNQIKNFRALLWLAFLGGFIVGALFGIGFMVVLAFQLNLIK